MTSRAFSLCSTACIATYRARRHKTSRVGQRLLAQLTVVAGSCLQGLKSASCSFRQCAFRQNGRSKTCVLDFASLGRDFLYFLVEEASGGCDFPISPVSISLGTKFQRIRLRQIEARVCLRKGVDVSAISSMQTVWRGSSRLAYPDVTLLCLASTELLR